MSQYQSAYAVRQPKRKWWTGRRKLLAFLCVIGAALVAVAVVPRALAASATHNYNDPGQLAQAVKAQEPGAVSAACAHLTGTRYTCAVDFPGNSLGSYAVTVAADGSSWSAS
ncbi:MAG TPA: hypothetical protein VGM12_30935 [Trebonia sp.]|jgi:hypothetical protein